ncbi:MAG: RNA polymerase sigma factor [Nitrospiria bacterium]
MSHHLINQDENDEREWVQKVQKGEIDAFEVLVQRYEKQIFNLLYRWLGDYDEAAEGAQEVFLAAYRSIRMFRGEARFSTWLYRIAINHAKNRRRRIAARRERTVSLERAYPEEGEAPSADLPDGGLDPEQTTERKEMQVHVHHSLNRLKPEEALLILLHDLQGLPYEEMAQVLNLPLGTVKSRLHRARMALKKKLTPYYTATREGI